MQYKLIWIKMSILNNIDDPRGHYAKWNKTDKDKYSYDFTCMWELESKTNEQT